MKFHIFPKIPDLMFISIPACLCHNKMSSKCLEYFIMTEEISLFNYAFYRVNQQFVIANIFERVAVQTKISQIFRIRIMFYKKKKQIH